MQKYFWAFEEYVCLADVADFKPLKFYRFQRNQFTCVDNKKNLYTLLFLDPFQNRLND
jgi:hypothetical protein